MVGRHVFFHDVATKNGDVGFWSGHAIAPSGFYHAWCRARIATGRPGSVPMLAIICAVLLVTSSGAAQSAPPVNDRANPYALVRNWRQLPEGRTLDAVSGVDVDRDGSSIWIADRCGGNACADSTIAPVLKLDAQGRLVKAFGAGLFAIPHGVHVDREGNIWVTPSRKLISA